MTTKLRHFEIDERKLLMVMFECGLRLCTLNWPAPDSGCAWCEFYRGPAKGCKNAYIPAKRMEDRARRDGTCNT